MTGAWPIIKPLINNVLCPGPGHYLAKNLFICLILESVAPYFITMPSNSTDLLHATVQLNCKAYGVPAPTLKWVKYTDSGETVIQTGGRFIVGTVFRNLYILKIHWSDAGRYGCIAQNQFGRVIADAHVIVVTGMLEVTISTCKVTYRLKCLNSQ